MGKNRKIEGVGVKGSDILVPGFAFKENCADIHNTLVIGVVHVSLKPRMQS